MKAIITLLLNGAWTRALGLLLLLALAPPASLYAQNPARGITFEHLTVEHGLSKNIVICLLQDRQGFMWFGTQDGLNKYDGVSS
jgi:ligand-binding sensor domain-containing protein